MVQQTPRLQQLARHTPEAATATKEDLRGHHAWKPPARSGDCPATAAGHPDKRDAAGLHFSGAWMTRWTPPARQGDPFASSSGRQRSTTHNLVGTVTTLRWSVRMPRKARRFGLLIAGDLSVLAVADRAGPSADFRPKLDGVRVGEPLPEPAWQGKARQLVWRGRPPLTTFADADLRPAFLAGGSRLMTLTVYADTSRHRA